MKTYITIAAFTVILTTTVACAHMQTKGDQIEQSAKPVSTGKSSTKSTHKVTYLPMPPEEIAKTKALFAESQKWDKLAHDAVKARDYKTAEHMCLKAIDAAPIIRGKKDELPFTRETLGEVYLYLGDNRNALKYLLPCSTHMTGGQLNLKVALAYARLGDYKNAKRFCPDGALGHLSAEKLPAIVDLNSLKADVLYAIGVDRRASGQRVEAEENFAEARKLIPDNLAFINAHAITLLMLDRTREALPLLDVIAKKDNTENGIEAKRQAENIRLYRSQHPDVAW